MLKDTTTSYGLISVILHWLTAITVLGLFALGYWMVGLSYYSSWYRTAPYWHKSIGILLLFAMLFRVIWRICSTTPTPVATLSIWEKLSSKSVHFLLYVILFGILISGYLISTADGRAIQVFNWFEIPSLGALFANQASLAGDIHRLLAYSIIGLVLLHALAALKHHFIDKDVTLKRMLGRKI